MIKTTKIIGLINLFSSPKIPGLNDSRALGATTFLGRYAIMDFALSNFSNSGIDKVDILVHRFPHSVISHVGNGVPWIRNTKTGYERLFYNEQGVLKPRYNTDLECLWANRQMFIREDADYYVIAPVHYICAMDFRNMLDSHIESKCKVTVAYTTIHDGKHNFVNSTVINIDENNHITSISKNFKRKDEISVALETYIINKDFLDTLIKKERVVHPTYGIREMLHYLLKNYNLNINAYHYEHYVLPITSYEDYLNSSFRMLTYESRKKMFREDWPIYTSTRNTPPASYGPKAKVSDSIISNGCRIYGTVEHSILSRNVIVNEGTVIKNSIIFTGTVVEEDAIVDHVVTDKNVKISKGKELKGKEDSPIIIKARSRI